MISCVLRKRHSVGGCTHFSASQHRTDSLDVPVLLHNHGAARAPRSLSDGSGVQLSWIRKSALKKIEFASKYPLFG